MTSTHSNHPLSVTSPISLNNAQRFEYQPLLRSHPRLGKYRTRKVGTACLSRGGDGARPKEDVVIVGAGIAGLATALSLHRLGIGSVVLEQADSLRTGGTSLTLFKNGWRVLDAMGVGSDLRRQFLEIQGMAIETEEGRELRSFNFKDADESQEVRAVERRTLLETLVDELPPDSVRFSSKLSNIRKSKTGETVLQLADGTEFAPKIVVGCDGVRSPVARWLGFPEPKYVGYCAFRGLASFPDGQPLEPRVNYIYGRGLRAGYVPVSPTKVYWFVSYNSASPGPKISDPSELMKQARNLVKGWPAKLESIMNMTPDETVIRTPLEDRWLWPVITPELGSEECVVLAGDAWHPMTPNLGQGGCCALEDAVVLAKKIAGAMRSGDGSISIKEGLRSYGRERWARVFPLCARAHLVGALLQWENPVVCSLRNNLIVPKLVRVGPLLEHTNFSCEPLTL